MTKRKTSMGAVRMKNQLGIRLTGGGEEDESKTISGFSARIIGGMMVLKWKIGKFQGKKSV